MHQPDLFPLYSLPKAKWADPQEVAKWATWRDAVSWCWAHQRYHSTAQNKGTQVTFRNFCELVYQLNPHPPHVSRWLDEDSKAPMDLPPHYVAAFESFTGWRGLTQFFNRKAGTTCLEEVQARLAA